MILPFPPAGEGKTRDSGKTNIRALQKDPGATLTD